MINPDLIKYELSKYCLPIVLMNLRYVSKHYYEIITKEVIHSNIISNINKMIQLLKSNYLDFCMHDSTMMVSGIGILQSIFGQILLDKNQLNNYGPFEGSPPINTLTITSIKNLYKFINTYFDYKSICDNVTDYNKCCILYLHILKQDDVELEECLKYAGFRIEFGEASVTTCYFLNYTPKIL